MPPKTAPGETISTVTTKIMRRLLEIQQDMDFNCLNHLTGVLTDLGTPSNDLGSMNVRDFFTPVGGATYTVDGVTTPKYTGLTFSIKGELEMLPDGVTTNLMLDSTLYPPPWAGKSAHRGYIGIVGDNNGAGAELPVRYQYRLVNTSYLIPQHWEVLYYGTSTKYSSIGASDPIVQFKRDGQFLTMKLPGLFNGGFGMGMAVSPYLHTTTDGTKQETRFVLQGTLLECEIIAESTEKAIRAAGGVEFSNMAQLLYADADPGVNVPRSKWTLGYIKGPLGPDGTIFDRS